jgi:hypothetical protein
VDTGSLYPALHRLERKKWIVADWKLSENNQRVEIRSHLQMAEQECSSKKQVEAVLLENKRRSHIVPPGGPALFCN